MSADKFVGELREPHYRIGVLQATLRHAREDIDRALTLLSKNEASIARDALARQSVTLADTLALIAKADGT